MNLKLIKKDEAYRPNLKDKRVQKRVSSVLDWCDLHLYEHEAVRLHSVSQLAKIFGQQQNPLSKWLRNHLLIQIGGYEPGKMNYSYVLREGAVASIRGMMGDAPVALSDAEKYAENWKAELATLTFNYTDKSNRLWHPLQNMRRSEKDAFWASYLPYDYDISACAPNLLTQTVRIVGVSDGKLEGVQKYLDEKGAFRQHVKELTGLTLQQSKAVINSMFNGARLIPHYTCATYKILGYDRATLYRLKDDNQVQELLSSIKEIWKTLAEIATDDKCSRWNIYFRLEREVIDVIHEYLRETDNAFFSEHDGWRCAKPVDTQVLEARVLERTGYSLKFDKN